MDHTLVYTGHEKLLTPLELVCLRGPQKGKKFPLIEGRQTYGRDAGNHIVLDCPTVSKNHGMLLYQEEGKITIYDTLSRNGISTQGRKKYPDHFKNWSDHSDRIISFKTRTRRGNNPSRLSKIEFTLLAHKQIVSFFCSLFSFYGKCNGVFS
ncbi:MAG: FHA domain-containing protein [Deltaproteobacteria bacterium]|nr:MAG: FHA domain-containing protein [Deltaproteobacteria bacterium]